MSLLDETSIFATVIHEGGFSHAAKKLGLSNGLITRKIKSLESRLGVSLLIRTTRKLKLTQEGTMFLRHAERIQQELEAGVCLLSSANDQPKGHIRISSGIFYARYYLTTIICDFLQEFPGITVEIIATNEIVDPLAHNIDLLFRGRGFVSSSEEDAHLKGRFLMNYEIGLYASPNYLATHAEPRQPDDLINHKIISYSNLEDERSDETWKYTFKGKSNQVIVQPFLKSDDVESMIAICKAGLGIIRISSLSGKLEIEAKNLRRILPDYCFGKSKMYVLYPYQSGLPKRVRLLLDYILARLPNHAKR